MDIIKLSAVEIREKILSKETTCQEVVAAFINQIKENEKYNAVLEIFSDSIEKAKEMDEKIANGFCDWCYAYIIVGFRHDHYLFSVLYNIIKCQDFQYNKQNIFNIFVELVFRKSWFLFFIVLKY